MVNPQKKATPFAAMLARRKAETDQGKKGGGVQDSDNHGSSAGGTTERLSVRIKALAAQRHFSVVDTSRKPSVAAAASSSSSSSSSLNALAPFRNSITSSKESVQPPPPLSTEPTAEQGTNKTSSGDTMPTTEKSAEPAPPQSSSSSSSSPSKSGKFYRQASVNRPPAADRSSLFPPSASSFSSSTTGLLPEERLDHVDRLIWLGLTHQVDNSDELHRKSAPTVARRFLRVGGRSLSYSLMMDGRDLADEDETCQKDNSHYRVKTKAGGVGVSHLSLWARKFRQHVLGTNAVLSGGNGRNQRSSTDDVNKGSGPDPGSSQSSQSNCLPFINPTTDQKVVPTAGGGGGTGTRPRPLHPRPADTNKHDQSQSQSQSRGSGDGAGRRGGHGNHSDDPYHESNGNDMLEGRGNHDNNNRSFMPSNNAGGQGQGLGYDRQYRQHTLANSTTLPILRSYALNISSLIIAPQPPSHSHSLTLSYALNLSSLILLANPSHRLFSEQLFTDRRRWGWHHVPPKTPRLSEGLCTSRDGGA